MCVRESQSQGSAWHRLTDWQQRMLICFNHWEFREWALQLLCQASLIAPQKKQHNNTWGHGTYRHASKAAALECTVRQV